MPKATQLNLTLENQTGELARLCRDLAHGGVNLLALCAVERDGANGLVRLLVANREPAEKELSKAGYTFTAEDVIFTELKHRPGALAKQIEKLADKSIGIRYAYATANAKAQTTAVVIAVDEQDMDRASKLLG